MSEKRRPQARAAPLYQMLLTTTTPRVLLAEDNDHMRWLLATTLRRDGFEVVEARDGGELADRIASLILAPGDAREAIDLIITDVQMPKFSGLDVIEGLRRADWSTPVIVITAFGDDETHAEAKRLGACAVFDKPIDLADVRTAALHFAGPW